MNFFQLIKWVLDMLYDEIDGDDAQKDAVISNRLQCLHQWYTSMFHHKGPACLDYGPPEMRFAYIYGYTTAHASYVHQLIGGSHELGALFRKDRIQVSCIGGGPGSDFLGILKYMIQEGKHLPLTCYLYDKGSAWGENWGAIAGQLEPAFRVITNFPAIDVFDKDSWRHHGAYLRSDFVTIVYFVSEVLSVGDATEYFRHLLGNAKESTLFLFIDINHPRVFRWFDCLAHSAGLRVLAEDTREILPTIDEQKAVLEPYITKFGWDPKLKSDIAYRIVQKP